MTDKEAIKYLQQLYPNGGHCWLDEQRIEAIGMAIKALQKEPKECMYSKDHYTDEDRKVLCDGCKEECKFNKKEYSVNNGLDLGCGVIWRDEEPASEDLEEAAKHYLYSNILYDDVYVGNPTDKDCVEMFKAGANWQKEQMMAKAFDVTIAIAYPNGYGGYTQLVDSQEALPFGEKVKVLVINKAEL